MEHDEAANQEESNRDASTQTEMNVAEELEMLQTKVLNLEKKLEEAENKFGEAKFKLINMKDDDSKVAFYTGFPSFSTLKAFLTSLALLLTAWSILKGRKRWTSEVVQRTNVADKELYHLQKSSS